MKFRCAEVGVLLKQMQQGLGALSKVGVAQNGTDEFEKK